MGPSGVRRLRALRRQLASDSTPAADSSAPFVPEPALTGGEVFALWPEDSPFIDRSRAHLPEDYNPNAAPGSPPAGVVNQVRGVHNPSCEVHRPTASSNGVAVLLVPGGGHNQLGVANCVSLVPFFGALGATTIIIRPRLRFDGYNMTTDAVFDVQQAIRITRAHATEWHLDPLKIGVLGFSAGAELATVRTPPPPQCSWGFR